MKKIMSTVFCVAILNLFGCHQNAETPNEIKVGTIAGPETTLMEIAKEVALQNYGLKIDIVPFSDYVLPNQALDDGSIDANMYQHQPYLDKAMAAKGYVFTVIGKTYIYPMGLYSTKHKSVHEIQENAVVAIPNDPSNEARSLLLIQKAGLIKLKDGGDSDSSLLSIIDNPKKLQFKEIDAAQLPRVLPDVAIAAINTNFAMQANLLPSRDAIFLEDSSSLYANVVVVNTHSKERPEFQKLMDALHSEAVQVKAKELFKDQAIKAW